MATSAQVRFVKRQFPKKLVEESLLGYEMSRKSYDTVSELIAEDLAESIKGYVELHLYQEYRDALVYVCNVGYLDEHGHLLQGRARPEDIGKTDFHDPTITLEDFSVFVPERLAKKIFIERLTANQYWGFVNYVFGAFIDYFNRMYSMGYDDVVYINLPRLSAKTRANHHAAVNFKRVAAGGKRRRLGAGSWPYGHREKHRRAAIKGVKRKALKQRKPNRLLPNRS